MHATSTSLAWHIRQDMGALKARLSGRKGTRSVTARDNCLSINAVFWILRTGAPWRDLFFQTMEIEKTPIAGFAVGVTGVFGKNSLKCSWLSLTMNR